MNRIVLSAAALAATCWLNSWLLGADPTLVQDGRPQATIVLAESPTRSAQFAAFELQHHLQAISGATVPMVRDGQSAAGIKLFVGESEGTKALGLKSGDCQEQEYLIRFTPRAIVLMGRDEADFAPVQYDLHNPACVSTWPGYWDERATTYAVHDFLARFCGVRWLNYTESGTVIPQTRTLTIHGQDVRRKPFFEYRDALGAVGDNEFLYEKMANLWRADTDGFQAWEQAAFSELHSQFPKAAAYNQAKRMQIRLFHLRMKNGGKICRCNHSLYGYYARFWEKSANPRSAQLFVEKRPDYFAKGYESVPPQMCYTSDGFIRQLARDAVDYLDGRKTGAELAVSWKLPNPFPIEPMDNSSFCKCDKCQAWLQRKLGEVEEYSRGTHSEYFFSFVNAVAKEVKKARPNARLVTLAYMTHAYPPASFAIDPSVAVQFCFACNRAPYSSGYQHELGLLREWAKQKGLPLYLWLYYTFPKETADNGKYHCFPGFFAHSIGQQFQVFRQCNVRGMFHCGYGQEVEAYVTYRLMDDPTLDVDALLADYFAKLYGPAAQPLKQLYLAIEKVYSDPANYPQKLHCRGAALQWSQLGTEQRMSQFARLMAQAYQAADSQFARKNVELFDKAVWSYMVAGRKQYTDRVAAPIPAVTAPAIPAAGGDCSKVDWSKAAPMGDTWYVRGGQQPAKRTLSGRALHDGKYLYLELSDRCDTSKLVTSATVFACDDWELYIAAQRAQPYRLFAVSPSAQVVGLSFGEVNWRQSVRIEEHGVKAVSDVSSPDKWTVRLAIPFRDAVPAGVKQDGSLYLNIIRVASSQVSGEPRLGIDTWVPFCTVHDVDRLAEIKLAEPQR